MELIHTKITQLREMVDFIRARGRSPPDHYYRDLDILHAEYDQLSQALVESREAFASSRLQVSLLQLRLPVLHVQILRHARGFACHLSLALPHLAINDSHLKIVIVHVTPQAIVPVKAEFQKIAPASNSPLEISLATDGDSLQGIPHLQSDGDSLQGIPPLQSDGDSLQRIPIHLSVGTHPVPRLVMVLLRDPHHGLLLPVHLRLLGKIKTLMNLLCLPQFGL